MLDTSQLPFLLKLIDDPSPQVRAKITRELRAFGPTLGREIEALRSSLTPAQQSALDKVLCVDDAAFRTAWTHWLNQKDGARWGESRRLESGCDLLARWQLGRSHPSQLRELLDDLTMEFLGREQMPDYEDLSHFLFVEKGLRGAAPDDYYNPLNNNLVSVIEHGQGNPISLAAVFILVGARLDLIIHGCNFPGHFLARVREDNLDILFDCFNEGRILSSGEVTALRKVAPRELEKPASALTIITRMLHNMANAYRQSGDNARLQFVLLLLGDITRAQAV